MIRSRGNTERTAIAALSVWMAVLSACVHGLHHHPAGDTLDGIRYGTSCASHGVAPSGQRPDCKAGWNGVLEITPKPGIAYCPACLFLKTCTQRAVTWDSPTIDVTPHKRFQNRDVRTSGFFVLTATPPRAPPASA